MTQSNLDRFLTYDQIHELQSGSRVEVLEAGATTSYRADPQGAHEGNSEIWIPTCTACQAVALQRETYVEALDKAQAPKELTNG